jgi:hypothetical protein
LCQKYGWSRELSKRVVWHDSANDGYCVFHAPEGMKRAENDRAVSPGEFKTLLSAHINVELIKSKGKFCNLAGAIIPCDLYLSEIALDKVVLPIGFQHVRFCGSVRGNGLNFQNVSFDRCIFEKDVDFRNATFEMDASFLKVKFNEVALFSKAKFPKGGLFTASEFKNAAWFNECEFGDHVIFHSVVAGNAAIRMHDLTKEALQWLQFSHLEVHIFSFSGCSDWPENFGFESPELTTDIKREELYRAMKQMAVGEHDHRQASNWHYKEKLMLLSRGGESGFEKMLLSSYQRFAGFGERPVRAGLWLICFAVLPFLFFAVTKLASTGISWCLDPGAVIEVFTDWQRALPLSKVPSDPPPAAWKLWVCYLSQLVITVQAALFGFAVRNRFRR